MPQGSVLGPLLYNIYSLDLQTATQDIADLTVQFADDTQLLITCLKSEQVEAHRKIIAVIEKVENWAQENYLILNREKTQILPIHGRNSIHHILPLPDSLTNWVVTQARNLGVMFDSTLNWNAHVDFVIKKGMKSMFALRKFTNEFILKSEKRIRYTLFYTLLIPQISFAISLLYPLSVANTKKLNRYIKSCASIITCRYTKSKDLHPLKLLDANELLIVAVLRLASASYANHKSPSWVSTEIKPQSNHRNLRSNQTFQIFIYPQKTFLHNFYMCMKTLSPPILSNFGTKTFIAKCKEHFIS